MFTSGTTVSIAPRHPTVPISWSWRKRFVPFMGSIRVSFELIKKIYDQPIRAQTLAGSKRSVAGMQMITFEEVTKIETLRRQIEALQKTLTEQSNYTKFGYMNASEKWISLTYDYTPMIKEIVCKTTVVKILKLLDESARLGVDVEPSKQILIKFLEEIKVQDENSSDLVYDINSDKLIPRPHEVP
jgi:hypothetical protein